MTRGEGSGGGEPEDNGFEEKKRQVLVREPKHLPHNPGYDVSEWWNEIGHFDLCDKPHRIQQQTTNSRPNVQYKMSKKTKQLIGKN